MTHDIDFFFVPYPSAQERRLKAALSAGLAHGSRIIPTDPLPGDPVTLLFLTRNSIEQIRVAVYFTSDGSEPMGEYGLVSHGLSLFAEAGEQLYEQSLNQQVQLWRATLPSQPEHTLVRYRADAWSASDTLFHCYADEVDPISLPSSTSRCFAYHVDRYVTPDWWQDAVVYQIFVDRFSCASDEPPLRKHDQTSITSFFGGTLNGVREKLDYLEALGINCIWLSPIFESPSHHGYNFSDFYHVDQRFGGDKALLKLIQECHRRGIKVLLDFVANHTSDKHAAFLSAYADPTSPTAAWYGIDASASRSYRSYAGVSNMPELQTDHPEVQRYLNEAGLYWLEYFGADGLRLDYVPGPSHTFWTLFQSAIKEKYPDAYTIGEITSPLQDISLYSGQMDGFMDFPLADQLRTTFARRVSTLSDLLQYLTNRQEKLPIGMSRGTLLDNHDMHRFLWIAQDQVERLKLAATCLFTLEGTPILYYGTEVGLSQYADAAVENAHARAPMLWGEEQDEALLSYYHRLVSLRHTLPVLRNGRFLQVPCQFLEPQTSANLAQVGAYLRYHQDGSYALVILNNNEGPVLVSVPLAAILYPLGLAVSVLLDVLSLDGRSYDLGSSAGLLHLDLAPLAAAVMVAFVA